MSYMLKTLLLKETQPLLLPEFPLCSGSVLVAALPVETGAIMDFLQSLDT